MTSILIDTNVLLDIIEPRLEWLDWSLGQVRRARLGGAAVLNPIVYAEASTPFDSQDTFDEALSDMRLVREDVPWEAAFAASKAHLTYRQKGGIKLNTLPDFFIAAHALVRNHTLVTRDAARFRLYFPELSIIAPDTHP